MGRCFDHTCGFSRAVCGRFAAGVGFEGRKEKQEKETVIWSTAVRGGCVRLIASG